MLASLMRLDPTQHTYADVLIKAFGPRSRQWIYALFVIELGTFSVAAIELFADSLNSLFPKVSSMVFKAMSYFMYAQLPPPSPSFPSPKYVDD